MTTDEVPAAPFRESESAFNEFIELDPAVARLSVDVELADEPDEMELPTELPPEDDSPVEEELEPIGPVRAEDDPVVEPPRLPAPLVEDEPTEVPLPTAEPPPIDDDPPSDEPELVLPPAICAKTGPVANRVMPAIAA